MKPGGTPCDDRESVNQRRGRRPGELHRRQGCLQPAGSTLRPRASAQRAPCPAGSSAVSAFPGVSWEEGPPWPACERRERWAMDKLGNKGQWKWDTLRCSVWLWDTNVRSNLGLVPQRCPSPPSRSRTASGDGWPWREQGSVSRTPGQPGEGEGSVLRVLEPPLQKGTHPAHGASRGSLGV